MKKYVFSLLLSAFALFTQAQVTLNVDVNHRSTYISPTLYGIFFEDINHAADGGLYAELVRNRSFDEGDLTAWSFVGQKGSMRKCTDKMLNEKQKNALLLTVGESGEGVENEGFWGMNIERGTQYKLSFWVRVAQGNPETVTAMLVDKNGQNIGEAKVAVNSTSKWQKCAAVITATGDDPQGHLRLTVKNPSEVALDVVSLFPPTFKNRENGCRPQLAQMLADMKPKFMRFPGGCYVEGNHAPENAFRWERTIGPIEERPGHMNANWGYWTTDGMGFHEFLQLSEDLGAKPLYVVNVGIWHGGFTPVEQLDGWIQECLDALEYANGPVTSKYGKLRAQNGHPEPFNIEYLEIGNENCNFHFNDNSDQSERYFERYRKFYDAVKAKYPHIRCIGNVQSWGTDNPSWRSKEPVFMVDEHYYRNPSWFADNYTKYDSYDRHGPRIYVGEYAVTSQYGRVGNLNAALGEAIFMMGMENNSSVVVMNSYAPIFVNENQSNWPTDMIHYNSAKAFGTPSYWVQQMFPTHIGTRMLDHTLEWDLDEPEDEETVLQPMQVGVGTWNTQAEFKDAQLIVNGKTIDLPAIDDWKANRGREPHLSVCPTQFKGDSYTYKVMARKTGGAEGFLLVYNYTGKHDYDWLNVAGWGNTQNACEQTRGGSKMTIGATSAFSVENDRWYELRVDVEGDEATVYIDGKKVGTAQNRKDEMRGVYANASLDEKTNTLYIKIVNAGSGSAEGRCVVAGGDVTTAEMLR
ncbi:MAG: carbohydrate binding domain-containing protein, partial [Bacteroidaceae bacterium]|nr:carbohydrate binding domain-containing protein [Bacteroidaceae bacterium]